MSKTNSDALYTLIKSLKKSEKRHFTLMASGEKSSPKYLSLFSAIDKQPQFDEASILRACPQIKPSQFSNTKAHLYKRILQSLKLQNSDSILDIRIREYIDYAQLLYNRSLYRQAENILKKAEKLAANSDNLELKLEILKWKKILLLPTVGRYNQKRAFEIINEVKKTSEKINTINELSNLSVQLNTIYLKTGYIRNKADYERLRIVFEPHIRKISEQELSFSEKLQFYRLQVEYYYFIQDFNRTYVYAQKWVDTLSQSKSYMFSRLENYVKALNYLLVSQNRMMLHKEFLKTKSELRRLRHLPSGQLNENIKQRLFKYSYVNEFDSLFMIGDFERGVRLMEKIKPGLERFINSLDEHSRIILYYKIACLYFGNSNFNDSIIWLNKIINLPDIDLRDDIHGFARILNLISHFELGNQDVIDYYIVSTYRFLLKKEDMNEYQKLILEFLKRLNNEITFESLVDNFRVLRDKLINLSEDPYEKRAFIYFDIISWLESKIEKKSVQEVVQRRNRAKIVANK